MSKYKVCSFNFIKAENNNKLLLDKVVYIDPGHGGADPGAIYKDIYESNINLEISKKLAYTLEQNECEKINEKSSKYSGLRCYR